MVQLRWSVSGQFGAWLYETVLQGPAVDDHALPRGIACLLRTRLPTTPSRATVTARSDEIKQRDARLKELRADLDKAEALVSEMGESEEPRRSSTRGRWAFRLSAPSLPSAMAPIGRL